MKKLIVFLVFVMLGTGLYAQQAGTSTFGVRAGGAFGLWSGLESDGRREGSGGTSWDGLERRIVARYQQSNIFNLGVALYYAYTFRDSLSLQIELNSMINQGLSFEGELWLYTRELTGGPWQGSLLDTWDDEPTYFSIDIPILLRYNFFLGFLGFGLMIGPHISIPVLSAWWVDSPLTFGATVALQGLLPIGNGRLVGDLRFVTDFNQVSDGLRRQAIVITAGYEISFGRR